MSQPANTSLDTFTCVRCGATVPVAASACPACGLEVYPPESSAEGQECRCTACGGAMTVDDRVCPHCGAEVVIAELPGDDAVVEYFCSDCGGEVAADDVICPHCGANVEDVEDAAADEDVEYVCSACGGEVAEDDVVCPHCGADVAEIEDAPGEAAEADDDAVAPAVALTVRQLHFLEAAHRLPEDFIAALTPLPGEKFVIPAREPKVGDILIRFILSEVVVSVDGHTEGRYAGAADAVDFIDDVVNDRVVFQFDGDDVEVYRADEIDAADEIDWSYYVWSGPLLNKRTGIDWYKP